VTNGKNAELIDALDQEEYRQVRGEMVDRDAFIRTTYLFSVSAVGALAWAVISLYLEHPKITASQMWWMTYSPALACVPLLFVMVAQRRDLVRGGAYIRVFFEDRFGRKGWQGRKEKFTSGVKGESNDPIIWFYYAVLFGCFLVNRALNIPCSYREVVVIVVVAACLFIGHRKFSAAAKVFRQECLGKWKCVLIEESL
jgi:hypothetical protein